MLGGLCDICGKADVVYTCPMCGKRVCTEHFNDVKGVCNVCLQGRFIDKKE